jgi:hypothetical protein
MTETEKCRHCLTGRVTKYWGLCWTCYYTPGVRKLYGEQKVGLGITPMSRSLPLSPTSAPPGSEEKILVLSQRAQEESLLWHPEDFGMRKRKPDGIQAEEEVGMGDWLESEEQKREGAGRMLDLEIPQQGRSGWVLS